MMVYPPHLMVAKAGRAVVAFVASLCGDFIAITIIAAEKRDQAHRREAETFGVIFATARTQVDKVLRTVTFELLAAQATSSTRPHDPSAHARPMNRPAVPERTCSARARFRARAAGDFNREKYRKTSFLRLGVNASQFFLARRFTVSPRRNPIGIEC
jgi:hypothetical protein